MADWFMAVGVVWCGSLAFAVSLCAVAKRSDVTVDRIRAIERSRGAENLRVSEVVAGVPTA